MNRETVNNNIDAIYELTSMQEGMFFHYLLNPNSSEYILQAQLEIRSSFDEELSRKALSLLMMRYEVLRTSFTAKTKLPLQVVRKKVEPEYLVENYRGQTAKKEIVNAIMKADLSRGVQLDKGLPIRITHISFDDKDYLIWMIHHIVIDGWCISVLITEFMKYYQLLKSGRNYDAVLQLVQRDKLGDLPYKEYVQWQKRQNNEVCNQYWQNLLSGYEEKQIVPMISPSDAMDVHDECEILIEHDAYENLKRLALENNVTISTIIETAYGILLQLRTGERDIAIGKVVSGRDAPLSNIGTAVGLYVNTIVSRIQCKEGQSVSSLLASMQSQATASMPYSQIPLLDVQKKYMSGGQIAGLYAFENYYVNPEAEKSMQEHGISIVFSREKTNYPLTLRAFENDFIRLSLMYDEKIFTAKECDLMLTHLKQILLQMCQKNVLVEEINGVSEQEVKQIVHDFNNTTVPYPRNSHVICELNKQIERNGKKTAIVYENKELSYEQLDTLSSVLAKRLREMGVERGKCVALLTKRTPELVVALVAILKVGGIYVPIDTMYPKNRVKMILEECTPQVILTDIEFELESDMGTVLRLDDPALFIGESDTGFEQVKATDPAYIIYTSGTTGRPKGTIITHRSILRLVKNANYARLDEKSCLLQMGAVAFDASTFEIWGMLLNGGTLYLANDSIMMDTTIFKQTVARYGINVMWMTAALFNLHVAKDASAFDGVEQLLIGGEKLSEYHVRLFQMHNKDTVLINGYGPTENTTFTTTYRIPQDFDCISIGKPISNTGVVIVRQGQICGIGMPGELMCWGDGLSIGYLKNPSLTKRSFVKLDGFEQLMYKTGDQARWLPDGNIEYLGRIDQQVKIRGFRVEMTEIEKAIRDIDSVQDCAVIVQQVNGENLLCAYVVGGSELNISDMRQTLHQSIPEYMIPTFWGKIDKIPLTVNGKVDRCSLPDIIARNEAEKSAPIGETEQIVAQVFGQILGLDKVYREDHFFDLGGHSLRAMMLINSIENYTGIRLSLKDVFLAPTVMGLATMLTKSVQTNTIPKAPNRECYLMSPAQQRMYILSKHDLNSVAYNMPCCVVIPGSIDVGKMQIALKNMISVHESLRTIFFEKDGEFYQQILEKMDLDIEFEYSDSEIDCQKYIAEFVKPFDLGNGPLVRMKFVQYQECNYVFFDMHHIISDGMSMNIFIRDLLSAYENTHLEAHKLHYRDYSEWMRTRDLSKQEEYWLGEMEQNVSVLNMPYDHVRPAIQSFAGGIVKQKIPNSLRKKILEISKQTGTTEFMILVSVLMILLSRYSNQEEVTIGTVVSGRTARETENMMGVFVNTLVLKENVREDDRYLTFLNNIKNKCLSAFDNQEYPFDLLCQKLNLARDLSRNALFDIMFSMQNNEENALPGKAHVIMSDDEVAAKFDLSVDVHPQSDGYQIDYTFCKAIYNRETIEQLAEHYLNLLESAVNNKAVCISELDETTKAEQEKLLFAFNSEYNSLPDNLNVVTQFFETAEAYPERKAVCYENTCCTYGELAFRVHKAAQGLYKLGVRHGDRVALIMNRGIDMIVSIYAVLAADAAYVPIEPTYPEDRRDYIIKDADPALIICDDDQLLVKCHVAWTMLSELENFDGTLGLDTIDPKNAAYIIYTSGTTGKPKGVVLRHDGLMNLCIELNRYAYKKYDVPVNGALMASYCFDASVQQLFVPLLYGHTLHIISDDTKVNSERIFEYFVQNQIRVSDGTPSHLKMLLEQPMPSIYADTFLIGGEVLSPGVAKEFIKRYGVTLYNVYGPTETTVDATLYECVSEDMERKSLPIGKPLNNVKVYILRANQLCGIGIPGELCISGLGVGEGYRNLPEETAKKFVENPFDGTIMYRTGDIARWRNDGNLEYIGRADNQVKIHGFRIENQEIEKVIAELYTVQDCAVAAKEINGDLTLCAYLVFEEDNEGQLGSVVSSLKKQLPSYMIPKFWAICKTLPKNNSGKLDYSRLDGELVLAEQETYALSQTDQERLVAEAFAEVTNCEKVGRNDDFFSLGGHSLNASRVINQIEKKTNVRLKLQDIFQHPVVSELAALISVANESENPILPCVKSSAYATTPAQLRIYMMQMIDEGGTAYNMPMCLRLDGAIDRQKVEKCLLALTKQHESLRTSFWFENGVLSQRVSEDCKLDFTVSEETQTHSVAEYMANFIQPFELNKAPLMRTKLVVVPDTVYLLVDMHHIISDGRSLNILIEDFVKLYSGQTLPIHTIHYKDYAAWLQKQDFSNQEAFWDRQFAEEVPALDLPTDFVRPQEQDFSGELVHLKLEKSLIEKLRNFIKGRAITEYAVFLSVLMVTLSKYARIDDVVVGTSASRRRHKETENMLGMFVNTLVLRGKPTREKRFVDFLQEIADLTIQAFDNQDYPFENIVNAYGSTRDRSRNPIFDVMFTLQNEDQASLELDGIKMQIENTGNTVAKFDLDVDIVPGANGYDILCAYATSLFKHHTVENIVKHFIFILQNLLENPECTLGDVPLITPEEHITIAKQFHRELDQSHLQSCETVIAAFEEQVKNNPKLIALEMEEQKYTYEELNKRANRLAHRLRTIGIQPDEPVVIVSKRSMDAIVAIYAIQKAGGAYFPIDPIYGKERIGYIVQDCGARIMLVDEEYTDALCVSYVEQLGEDYSQYSEENLPHIAGAKNLMYLTSTSGSTGLPKSVMIENGAVLSYVNAFSEEFHICREDVVLQQSALNFDTVVEELYPAHLCGGKVVLLPQDRIIDVELAYQYIVQKQVTVISCSTLLLNEFNNLKKPCSVRLYLNGGDVLKYEYIDYLQTYAEIGNTFGPTECTVCATLHHVPNASGKIHVGHPIPGVKLYVVNGNNQLCGIGVPGELWIGGIGVGRGYLNRGDLNREKFVANPFGEGRIFKTGDGVCWLPDGNLEYLGRIDQQVKIRGFRVELGEIESTIRKNSNIKECVVIARNRENGDRYLCAYYVTKSGEEIDNMTLKDELAKFLPNYMVPQYIMHLQALPLTGSGKVNKRKLPEIRIESGQNYEEPKTEEERLIAEAFQTVLEVEKVGRNDNFFELGGHSLRALRLLNVIEESRGVRIALKEVFAHPTVKEIARVVTYATGRMEEIQPAEKKAAYEMSSMQRRLYMIHQIDEMRTSYNMPACFELMSGVDLDKLQAAVNGAVERHEALRTRFDLVDGIPMQIVEDQANCPITINSKEEGTLESCIRERIHPFDLSKAPLMRMEVVKVAEKMYLLIDMHHIIMDGMSINILISDITKLYHGEELSPLKVQYKDYSEWMHTRDLSEQQAYWKRCYQDAVEPLDMPTDYKRPQRQNFAGASVQIIISSEISWKIQKLAASTGTTEYMVLMSAVGMMLQKYSWQEDIVVGTAIANRPTKATEQMLGMFVNTLAIRLNVPKQEQYDKYLEQLKKVCLGAFENQEYPFEELVNEIDCTRDLSRNPLFDVIFTFQNNEEAEIDNSIVKFVETDIAVGAKFDLSITIAKKNEQYICDFSYRTDLYEKETIAEMAKVFKLLLSEISAEPKKALKDYSLIQDIEQIKSLGVQKRPCTCATIAELFEQQVTAHPTDIAVVFGKVRLSYAQLNKRANVLAHRLIAVGVNVEDRIVLLGDRSEKMIEMILGVTKAGAAYVPVDPTYPEERRRYILEDVAPKLILTTDRRYVPDGIQTEVLEYPLKQKSKVIEEQNPDLRSGENNAAYIIYTSGTTGAPKGVVVEHRGIGNLRDYFVREQHCGKGKKSLQFASFSFDAAISEISMSILSGGCICIADEEARQDTACMERFLIEEKITHAIFPPAFFQELDIRSTYLERIITAGSESNYEIVKKALEKCAYSNDYGPTEATVCATHGQIEKQVVAGKRVTIGKPLENVEVYVLQGEKLCGIGMPGELCIGGIGVARGYLNRSELTAEKFVNNPFGEGRLYRTGDLTRWLPDGTLEYLGRIDQQVKIRGFRVELGEIEAVLRKYPGIKDSVVIVQNDQRREPRICAYYVAEENVVEERLLRDYLATTLPGYMFPNAMMRIDHIPLNQSGKVNKRKLPEIRIESGQNYEEPKTEEERLIAEAFQTVLEVEKVGRNDNFFELGGDSITIMRVKTILQQNGYDFSIVDFMQNLDVSHCALALRRIDINRERKFSGIIKPTPILHEFLEWKLQRPEHFNQSVFVKLHQPDLEAVQKALDYITQYHDALRMVFRDGTFIISDVGDKENYGLHVYQEATLSPDKVTIICQKLQESFDLANGPLLKVALFEENDDAHLFMVVHHLAVDAVSWNILLDDFKKVYLAYREHREIQLAPKAMSYIEWSELLEKYSTSSELENSIRYWETLMMRMPTEAVSPVTANRKLRNLVLWKTEISDINATVSGSAADNVLGCGFHEIIAAAVAYGRGLNRVGMMVESHGRNEILNQTPDGTVGWFTSESPMVIDCEDNVLSALFSASRGFEQLTYQGISYSILRYITKKIPKCNPELGYNFFSRSFDMESDQDNYFSKSSYSGGRDISEQNIFGYPISVTGVETEKAIKIEFQFSEGYSDIEVETCIQRCRKAFEELNEFCRKMVKSESILFNGEIWKIKDFKRWILDSYAACEKPMLDATLDLNYSPTYLQKICLDTKDNVICTHRVWLPAEETNVVVDAIRKVVREQSAFRTGYNQFTKKMLEYPEDAANDIMCLDISNNTSQTVELVYSITELTLGVNQAFKNSPLLSKIVVYKTLYGCMVYVFAHHAVSDLRSSLVFENRLRFYLNNPDHEVVHMPRYSELCQKNLAGDMKIEPLLVAAKNYSKHLSKLSSTHIYKFRFPVQEDEEQKEQSVVEQGIRIMKQLIKQNGYSGQFPMIIVYHGRSRDNSLMYGLFLRAVSVLFHTDDNPEDEKLILDILDGKMDSMPNFSIMQRLRFMKYWKSIPVLNASVSYGVNFGLTKDSIIDDALQENASTVKPSSVMIQSGSNDVTLILGGCVEDETTTENWVRKKLNLQSASEVDTLESKLQPV